MFHIVCQSQYHDIDEDLFRDCYNTNPNVIEKPDSDGNTPLHIAASKGKSWKVRFLVENGANVNSINRDGKTTIILAAEATHDELVAYLLDNGARANPDDVK